MPTIPIEKLQLDPEVELDMTTFSKSASFIHIFKCQTSKCRLEFAVFSWKQHWPEQFQAHCPECGTQNIYYMRTRSVPRAICEIVHDPRLGQPHV